LPSGKGVLHKEQLTGRSAIAIAVLSACARATRARSATRSCPWQHAEVANMVEVLIRDYCGRNGITIPDQQALFLDA
jgi:hypothetical protein